MRGRTPKGQLMIQPLEFPEQHKERSLREWFRLHGEYVRALERERLELSASLPEHRSIDLEAIPKTATSLEEFETWWKGLPDTLRERLQSRYEAGLEETMKQSEQAIKDALHRRLRGS